MDNNNNELNVTQTHLQTHTHFENFWLATPETILARTVWTYLEK